MSSNMMWGGRFSEKPDAVMDQINVSIDFDKALYRQDIQGSKAHTEMLMACDIITLEDGRAILDGLRQIEKEIEEGKFTFKRELEDIHMNVEARLKEIIGEAAGRLHSARSRNDQVATDFRLYVRDFIDNVVEEISTLQLTLAQKSKQYSKTVMPGFTHLQTAQPVTFGHHLLAYVEMFERDKTRFIDARKRLNECPLGSAALAGTSFPIDRFNTAEKLGFDKPCANSLDGVSDRDFVLEVLSHASICAMHASRIAEEIVIWSSAQFRFVTLPDRFTTGSSIMPQKRNPDAAELVRAKIGRITGAFHSLLMVMKGLPLAYSKDMQEDKEVAFDGMGALLVTLAALIGMIKDIKAEEENMYKAASSGFSTATDLADWCVRVLNIPFRDAHHITGKAVAVAEHQGIDLKELDLASLQDIEPRITEDVFDVLSVESSVESRKSYGGTAPSNVVEQAEKWLKKLSS